MGSDALAKDPFGCASAPYGAPRRATTDDVASIVAWRSHMFVDMGVPGYPTAADVVAAAERWFAASIAAGTYRHFFITSPLAITGPATIARPSDEIVASGGIRFVDYPPSPTDFAGLRGYLMNVYVAPDHRRRGLARTIVGACLDACRECGIRVVALHASSAGRPLYESLGFAPTPEMRVTLG